MRTMYYERHMKNSVCGFSPRKLDYQVTPYTVMIHSFGRSFEYCGSNENAPKEACLISGMNLQDDDVKTENSEGCDHYSRQFYMDGIPVLPNNYRECSIIKTTEEGFDGGSCNLNIRLGSKHLYLPTKTE